MLTLLLAFPLSVCAGQESAPVQEQAPPSPKQELAALQARYDASSLSYPERFAAFRDDYAALAARHSGTAVGMSAEVFLLTGCWWLDEDQRFPAAAAQIAHIREHYARSEHLVQMIEPIRYLVPPDERDPLLAALAEENPHDAVDGVVLLHRARLAGGETRKEMFRELRKRYGGVKYKYAKLRDLANAHLRPHSKESLAVGQPAPEILGVDLEGQPMKLSDFRGKVVVLDFWGDW